MRHLRINTLAVLSALVALAAPLSAQFGQNIVQYDRYKWSYIQSPHFDIYFYGDDLTLAEFTSEVAEEAYTQISDRLNWRILNRVPIMIYRSHVDFQQTNVIDEYMSEGIGGVTELYKNRVVVPFEGSYDDFRHVVRHELVHAVMNDMIYGGNVQSIISGRVRYSIPTWMSEGISEYLAGGWDTNSDMYLRDLALYGEIPPVQQLDGIYAYRGGQSVWRFITGKYGEESIAEIFARIKINGNVERGLTSAIGADYDQLSEQWNEYLKVQYWPDITGRERLDNFAYKVTDHIELENSYNIAPSISPDGSKLAIMRNDHGTMEIVLISATDGRFLKRLIRGGTTAEFEELHILQPGIAWSPDGKNVAFGAKAASQEILYVVDIKTEKVEKYPTGLEGIFMASWSPDGEVIALIGNNGVTSDLYLLDLETEQVTNLTRDIFGEFNPVWSPDGTVLVFSSDRGDYPALRFDQDNNSYEFMDRYHPDYGIPLSSVSPDFEISRHTFSQLDIFSINRDGSNLRRITEGSGNENYPVYAHTEPYLYYTSDRSGIDNIYMYNLETGEERAVTNVTTGISDLNMATDDSRLYFTGFEQLGYDIYRIHNPNELWNNPKTIAESNFILTDSTATEVVLVNDDRGINYPRIVGDYGNYVFGLDNPETFIRNSEDSLAGEVVLEEGSFIDEEGEYRIRPYKTRFTLDLVQTYASYSTLYSFQGMTEFLFSDILGNHRISLATEMQISLENSDYYITYHLLPFRTNYYFTIFHSAYLYYPSMLDARRARQYGVSVFTSRPLNRFRRLEAGLVQSTVEHTWFAYNPYSNSLSPYAEEKLTTLLPQVGYVWDNAEWDYLYPVNGWRSMLYATISPKWNEEGIVFQTLTLDVRKYIRSIGGTSFAFRLSGGASFGADAQNFLVGGLPWLFSSDAQSGQGYYGGRYKQDPLGLDENSLKTIYFSEYLTPLRGTRMMELVGTRAALINLEYRFPFLVYYFPALGELGQLGGVLFTDLGFAWNETDVDYALTFGWGPRFVLLGLPFQFDYAWQYKPSEEDRGRHWYLTIGLDF